MAPGISVEEVKRAIAAAQRRRRPGVGHVRAGRAARCRSVAIISSRTPEGQPGWCPVCGAEVAVTPADPLGDAPCPACGTLLWPVAAGDGYFLLAADELTGEKRAKLREIAARLRSADGDSLDRVEMLMELEEALGISIPDDAVERFETVEDFLDWWLRGRYDRGMTPTAAIPLPSPAYLANSRWVQANWEQLVQRYPNQWIAVDQGRVLAADANRGRVADRAQQMSPSSDVLYEFVATISLIFRI